MAAALRQSGLTTALIQRAQGRREGQVAEEKEAPAVDASRTTACLDFADATNANPLSSSSDTSLLPWPMLDDFHLKLTLSMLGTIALFHVDDLASSSPTPSPSPPPSLHELIAVLAPHFLENTEVVEREEEKGARNPNKRRLVASVLAEIVDTNSAAADICSREVRTLIHHNSQWKIILFQLFLTLDLDTILVPVSSTPSSPHSFHGT